MAMTLKPSSQGMNGLTHYISELGRPGQGGGGGGDRSLHRALTRSANIPRPVQRLALWIQQQIKATSPGGWGVWSQPRIEKDSEVQGATEKG